MSPPGRPKGETLGPQGQGEPMSTWILLRGLTRESGHWGDFLQTFRGTLAEAKVIALDLPGNGRLYAARSPLSVEAMAQHCRAELRARGIEPPYHLLAMSLGAMVAIAWAAGHPDELAGCVLINTSVRPLNAFFRRLRPSIYARLLATGLANRSPRAREAAILRLTSRRPPSTSSVLDDWVDIRLRRPVSRANAIRQLFAAARFRAPPALPAPPVLILASARDALVDPRCSRQLAGAWACDFAEHPGAGHDLPLDDGRWVAQQVRKWLAARRPPAGRDRLQDAAPRPIE
jgi:pimeloyl-ACP methyl ester carboxylesterase